MLLVICQRVEQNTNHVHQSVATNVCFVAFFCLWQIYNLLCWLQLQLRLLQFAVLQIVFEHLFKVIYCRLFTARLLTSWENCSFFTIFLYGFHAPRLLHTVAEWPKGRRRLGENLRPASNAFLGYVCRLNWYVIYANSCQRAQEFAILTGYKMCLVQLE